jgi:peroxiredoxin family protein
VLAAILASGDPERLYTGLSLLVSTATAGEEARALVTFGALRALQDPPPPAHVVDAEREPFLRTFAEMRDLIGELPNCRLFACAASVQGTGVEIAPPVESVLSMPRFLADAADARLVVV